MKRMTFILVIIAALSLKLSAQWINGQDAEYVMGQIDFQSNAAGVSATSFDLPYDVVLDPNKGKMYVVDLANHRVLRFSYPITGNQPEADLVFGQPDMTSNGANRNGTTAANSLFYPTAVAIDGGALWICDQANHRILKFNNASSLTTNGPNADVVLGQPDFTSSGPGTAQNKFFSPYDIVFDREGNLWVADMSNNRVLRFDDAADITNGANADGVLGQTNFTNSFPGTSQSTMMGPSGVTNFESHLFVADMANNRVLRFDDAVGKANGANADGVLGQADFTSGLPNRGGAAGQNTLSQPFKIEYDWAGRIYVSDQNNRRCLIFYDAVYKNNGANADRVLGKTDYVSTDANTTQNLMSFPNGAAIDNIGSKFIITDEENNRVLQFESVSALLLNGPESIVYDYENNCHIISNSNDGKLLVRFQDGYYFYFNSNASTSIRGITIYNGQLYAAADDGIKVFDLATGTNTGTYPVPGSAFLNDIAADSDGNIYASDNPAHKIFKLDAVTTVVTEFADMGADSPNGLYVDEANNRLIVVNFSPNASIKAVDLTTGTVTNIITTTLNLLDGITADSKGNYYVSAWGEASVYKFNNTFTTGPELIIDNLPGPADIFYDTENNILCIPVMGRNDVTFMPMPGIKLLAPNGGEVLDANTVFNIEWESNSITNIKIEYTSNSGADWVEITETAGATSGSYAWTIPNFQSVECLIKLTDTDDAGNTDQSDGVFTVQMPVSVESDNNHYRFYLSQNYPNPFNPSTVIEYSIPDNEFVSLKVFDILGREKAALVNEKKPAGLYKTAFDCSDLPSGIYFYKLTSGSFSATRKMILVH